MLKKSNTSIISNVFLVITYIIILTYIYKMKQLCSECTNIFETNLIFYITIILLVNILLVIFFNKKYFSYLIKYPYIAFFILLLNIFNVFILYRFINKLMINNNCKSCTDEWRRTYLYYFSRIALVFYIFSIVLMIISFSFLFYITKSLKIN
jgi:hypothetical protein